MAIILTPAPVIPLPLYSDVNLNINQSSQADIVYNIDAIQNSIATILGTRVGTRVFRRDFGSYLEDLLWNPMDDITVGQIKNELVAAITTWEPRVSLTTSTVVPDYPNEMYYVRLDYTVPSLNGSPIVFTFNLKQG